MASNIGKRDDDPDASLMRYPERVLQRDQLSNGNFEVKYRARKKCMVFFEVDKDSKVIVNWRFEGSEKDCAIVP